MNTKSIIKHMNYKLNEWVNSIDNETVKKAIKDNIIVSGGAIVSLLNNETPNDYDIYFKNNESACIVSKYYADRWNESHEDKIALINEDGRVQFFISSKGVAMEDDENCIDDSTEPWFNSGDIKNEEKYRPRYFSSNAVSLTDKIQIVIRFTGEVEEIHKNYDFLHCTCSYDFKTEKLTLPQKALEAIINKELIYNGSKYPLCSIIRTRKFIKRGWSINAGQYLKMCLQLNEFDLTNIDVLKDQTTGVDSAYFSRVLDELKNKKEQNGFSVNYLIEIIDRIF